MAAIMTAGLGWLGLSPVAGATTTAGDQVVRLAGAQPAPLSASGARLAGSAPAGAVEHLQLYFSSPEAGAMVAEARAVADPSSPEYHRYLTVSQFRARYQPSPAATAAVNRYLQTDGVQIGTREANGLSESVSGTVRQVDAALHTDLQRVRTAKGAEVIGALQAPGLPRTVAGAVSYVDGLTPWIQVHDDLRPAPVEVGAARPAATASAVHPAASGPSEGCNLPGEVDGNNPNAGMGPRSIGDVYRLGGFYSRGDAGQGQTIGLIEYDSYDPAAVEAWANCTGEPHPSIDREIVDADPPSSTPATLEATYDIQVLLDVAPAATIAVYEENNDTNSPLDPYDEAITDTGSTAPLPSVISSSWGLCEPATSMSGNAFYTAEEDLFAEATVQGQSIVVASGDQGSEGCYGTSGLPAGDNTALEVNDPASDPFATAVGGTQSPTVLGRQSVWNSTSSGPSACSGPGGCVTGASGGGLSTVWGLPAYQPTGAGLQSGCTEGGAGCREVPDVSALAGDYYAGFCTDGVSPDCPGGVNGAQFFEAVGGTSLAAPSWGATVALANVGCNTTIGFLNPLLYQATSRGAPLVGSITSGENDYTDSHGGAYGALSSGRQNLATGLGALGGVDLSSGALCRQVVSLASGAVLTAGQQVESPNFDYSLVMQSDGNLVEYLGTRAVFNTGTSGNPGAHVTMQADGNLVVYSSTGTALFNTGTSGHAGAVLSLQNDSNLVVYQGSTALYNAGRGGATLTPGHAITSGQELLSNNATYRLIMQSDGNLVEYLGTRAVFNTGTAGHAGAYATMQTDGNFVVYAANKVALFSTRTSGHAGAYVTMQCDGNLVVYQGSTAVYANHA